MLEAKQKPAAAAATTKSSADDTGDVNMSDGAAKTEAEMTEKKLSATGQSAEEIFTEVLNSFGDKGATFEELVATGVKAGAPKNELGEIWEEKLGQGDLFSTVDDEHFALV